MAVDPRRRLLASSNLRHLASLLPPGRWLLTGGSLRDRLLGRSSHDHDLVVLGDASRPAQALARRLSGRIISLGREPDVTWRIVAPRWNVDVWGVAGSLAADARRRDFTVNALMWWFPKGPLMDLVGGLEDLVAGRLQVVDPDNLRADPLRVLRGFRLAATHPELRPTAAAEKQLAEAAGGLRRAAGERVCDEIRRLARGPAAGRTLAIMLRLRILEPLTGVSVPPGPEAASLSELLEALGSCRGPLRRHCLDLTPLPLVLESPDELNEAALDRVAPRLAGLGWSDRKAASLIGIACIGERLLRLFRVDDRRGIRSVLAADTVPLGALAWAVARIRGAAGNAPEFLPDILNWLRRFSRRPPLLSGAEVAELLRLPPGPDRSRAVEWLRQAQARGEIRSARQARRRLQSLRSLPWEDSIDR